MYASSSLSISLRTDRHVNREGGKRAGIYIILHIAYIDFNDANATNLLKEVLGIPDNEWTATVPLTGVLARTGCTKHPACYVRRSVDCIGIGALRIAHDSKRKKLKRPAAVDHVAGVTYFVGCEEGKAGRKNILTI